MSEIKITVLVENRVDNPLLIAEQGLALHIETSDGIILFDTGQGTAICHNSIHLGLDMQNIDRIIISHGHYDHGGGLLKYLQKYGKGDIITHSSIFNKKFSLVKGEKKYIGLPFNKDDVEKSGGNITFMNKPFEIMKNAIFSGEITRITEYEEINEKYVERILESYITDELTDEAALYITTQKGIIVIMGCGHRGVVNTVKHAMKVTGNHEIFAVIGGMHLKYAGGAKIDKITHALMDMNVQHLIPLHCTGFKAISKFMNSMGNKVKFLNVGDVFEV